MDTSKAMYIGDITFPLTSFTDNELDAMDESDLIKIDPEHINLNIYDNLDETLDAQLKYQQIEEFVPTSPCGPPRREMLLGKYNFGLEINSCHTQKKTYLYSNKLNRIYVNVGCNFSVNFNWDKSSVVEQHLYVRATTVFSELAEAQKRVETCLHHAYTNVGMMDHVAKNVLRSARGSSNMSDVFYCGRADASDSWYSVLVRFGAPASHAYLFTCKNSCTSGINRRATEIIFTLEDCNGTVLGRQSVGVRICSCPKRDMLRDEDDPQRKKKRPITATEPPTVPTKRPLHDTDGYDTVVSLPALDVIGRRTAITGLRVMIDMMETMKASKSLTPQSLDETNKSINNLKNYIDSIKHPRDNV